MKKGETHPQRNSHFPLLLRLFSLSSVTSPASKKVTLIFLFGLPIIILSQASSSK
jgi:hypothetical protein